MSTNMSDIKYCQDCKHSVPSRTGFSLHCGQPELSSAHSLVCRRPDPETLPYCAVVRFSATKCGSSGMFFEAKPEPTPRRKWWQFWL